MVVAEVLQDLGFADRKQRPDNIIIKRKYSAQTFKAAAPQEVQEH